MLLRFFWIELLEVISFIVVRNGLRIFDRFRGESKETMREAADTATSGPSPFFLSPPFVVQRLGHGLRLNPGTSFIQGQRSALNTAGYKREGH